MKVKAGAVNIDIMQGNQCDRWQVRGRQPSASSASVTQPDPLCHTPGSTAAALQLSDLI